jgi:hypothetical protein
MQCRNHADRGAIERCAGCAEPFCGDCLVEMHGQKYCGSCKVMALKGEPVVLEHRMRPCKEADEALKFAIIGIFCVGFILAPVALFKAADARRSIRMDPELTGAGKANAAKVIAIVVLALWVIGLVGKFSRIG